MRNARVPWVGWIMAWVRPTLGVLATLLFAAPQPALAGADSALVSARFCEPSRTQDAAQQDRVLRFAALIRDDLAARGEQVLLIARSGIDLSRVNVRYSHSGILLAQGARDRPEGAAADREAGHSGSHEAVPWSVRQLYFDCGEGRPRIFDQGLAGFLVNADQPDLGFVSVIALPAASAQALLATVLDRDMALDLLAGRYSANAYPFSERYQNCNQWVIEVLAAAWAPLARGEGLRARAQAWLRQADYRPEPLVLDSHLTKFAASFMPLIHLDDHPEDEQVSLKFTVTLPDTIETFVKSRLPAARRIEYCHNLDQAVVREGWSPIATGCQAQDGDRVVALR